MGARAFMCRGSCRSCPSDLDFDYVGRPERASPGEGYPAAHNASRTASCATALDLDVPVERVPARRRRASAEPRRGAAARGSSRGVRADRERRELGADGSADVRVDQRRQPVELPVARMSTGSSASMTRAPTAPSTLRARPAPRRRRTCRCSRRRRRRSCRGRGFGDRA